VKAASCFSGIGAPEQGGPQFDWLWSAEVEPFPSAVLSARFPHSVNLGDITADDFIDRARSFGPLDLLVGGPPCQAFSVAGLRKSMSDDRGNLSLRFVRIAHAIGPRNLLVENVPGWLNTPDNAFGCFLGAILGADDALHSPADGKWPGVGMASGPLGRLCWATLDAQWFGVAQRRRRVFVVADFGEGADPAAVLFERKSLSGNTAPRREAGQAVAPTISARTKGGGGLGTDFDLDGGVIAESVGDGRDVSATVSSKWAKGSGGAPAGDEHYNLVAGSICRDSFSGGAGGRPEGASAGHFLPVEPMAFDTTQITSAANFSNPKPGDPCHPLAAGAHIPSIAWSIMPQNSGKDFKARAVDVAQPVMAGGPVGGNQGGDYIQQAWQVRRLTPTECERLQGFPDDFTNITYRGKLAADGPRYKALGNSWAVPCGAWIIGRIAAALSGRLEQAA
jgi:DNA (cytosine-5)-methyltransferase 1